MTPLVVINAVGLTPRLLPNAPRLNRLAQTGGVSQLKDVLPAVTCTAQATLLTGAGASRHGIVGNGWFFRDTGEVRFWQQSNHLLQAEPVYATARRLARQRGRTFTCAKLFWWFNQGASVGYSVTPKPYYGADGNKIFGIYSTPANLGAELEKEFGSFPFFTFWGPKAGLPCTQWIAEAAGRVLKEYRPDLTLVYLPHLDYDPQRWGPGGSDMPRLVNELDQACAPLLDAASARGARVWVVSEYGHVDVERPVYLNRLLRQNGFLQVRKGPFGEAIDFFESRAFAVVDHQVAHVYVKAGEDRPRVRDLIGQFSGVSRVFMDEERKQIDLQHERAGDLVVLSEPRSWFAYPYWLDERDAPDYARTVDIHRKPGYDPCELLVDNQIRFPGLKLGWRFLQKKLGFRTLFDVIPLDAGLIKGSHGLVSCDPADGPLWIHDRPEESPPSMPMTAFRHAVLEALDLQE